MSVDDTLRVLRNPVCRRILVLLAEEGPLERDEIAGKLGFHDTGALSYYLELLDGLLERNGLGRFRVTERGMMAYQLIKEVGEEYTIGVHPLTLLLGSLPALLAAVVILAIMVRTGAVSLLAVMVLAAIIIVVLVRVIYGLAGRALPYLKVRREVH